MKVVGLEKYSSDAYCVKISKKKRKEKSIRIYLSNISMLPKTQLGPLWDKVENTIILKEYDFYFD